MKQGYTHIVVVLDRSGSMDSCKKVTLDGFNEFLRKQQALKGEGSITLVQFDDQYEVNYDFLPLSNAPQLNHETYQPRGMTALLDAIGKTIDNTGKRLASLSEEQRPERVIFVIQTDGFENASVEYVGPEPDVVTTTTINGHSVTYGSIHVYDKASKVRSMIQHQREKYNWDFIFLGAGQDAVLEAQKMGIPQKSSLTYTSSKTDAAFRAVSSYVTGYRGAVDSDAASVCSFSEEDRTSSV
jgi:hypothetical protein